VRTAGVLDAYGGCVQRIVYSSNDLIGDETLRKEQWISSLSSGYAHLRADPSIGRSFEGELRIARTNDVAVGTIHGTVKSISRTTSDIAAHNTNNVVLLLNAGQYPLGVDQSGKSVELAPGASVLIEQSAPSIILASDGQCGLVAVQTERERVRQRCALFEDGLMTVVSGPSVVNGLLRAYIDVLVGETAPTIPLIKQFAADHIADLIAATASIAIPNLGEDNARFGISSRGRLMSARRYISQRLEDPFLSEEGIAAHVRVSTSQLRKDFERCGLSVGRYVREQRLEKAVAMLRDPALRRHRIIDIAFACGFRNLVTFNRVFRAAYGMPPSELRQVGAPHFQ
jgi:AraC-like DNA-binding protein